MRARSLHPHPAAARILGWLLVFILAQTLGWVHRGLHALPHGPAAPVAGHTLVPHAVGDHGAHSWVERLFADHTQSSDCRLYDTLTHAEGLPVSSLPLVVVPALALWVPVEGVATGRSTVSFDARGPPLSLKT